MLQFPRYPCTNQGIRLISPNSASKWMVGDMYKVTWQTNFVKSQTEIPDGINMDLVNADTNEATPLVYGIPYFHTEENEFSFVGSSLPLDLLSSSHYYVKASYKNIANMTVMDISALFSVRNPVSPADSPSFEFTFPTASGNSTLAANDTNLLQWTFGPTILQSDAVNISLYHENGTFVSTLAENYQNNGVFSWTAPAEPSNHSSQYFLSIATKIEETPKEGTSGLFKILNYQYQ